MIEQDKNTQKKVCTFCGHHDADSSIYPALLVAIEKVVLENQVTLFYVGNQGSFDHMALKAIKELKERYPQISYSIILAYMPGEKTDYDNDQACDTLFPDGLETVPRRYAIVHRNRWMVDHSDCIIAFVQHGWGGAAQTLKYAQNKRLIIVECNGYLDRGKKCLG
jgi:uncharacterized phage-like protein YoqJ